MTLWALRVQLFFFCKSCLPAAHTYCVAARSVFTFRVKPGTSMTTVGVEEAPFAVRFKRVIESN